MIKILENKMEKMQESINKDLEELKDKYTQTTNSSTIQEPYTNHWTKLRRAETKRKKEFNPEAWEKEISNIINLYIYICNIYINKNIYINI